VQYTHFALPLDQLLSGERLPYDLDAPLAVFGQGFETRTGRSRNYATAATATSSLSPANDTADTPGSSTAA
jgi:hypothetical protein